MRLSGELRTETGHSITDIFLRDFRRIFDQEISEKYRWTIGYRSDAQDVFFILFCYDIVSTPNSNERLRVCV